MTISFALKILALLLLAGWLVWKFFPRSSKVLVIAEGDAEGSLRLGGVRLTIAPAWKENQMSCLWLDGVLEWRDWPDHKRFSRRHLPLRNIYEDDERSETVFYITAFGPGKRRKDYGMNFKLKRSDAGRQLVATLVCYN